MSAPDDLTSISLMPNELVEKVTFKTVSSAESKIKNYFLLSVIEGFWIW